MQCYTELIAPSGVTHAVSLPLLNPNTYNLVVAKTSLLQIFRLGDEKPNANDDDSTSSRPRLLLIGEYPLAGTVTSLAAIKALDTKTGGDTLLISFSDAKLSLVEWDPDNHRISTVSIHYYEAESIKASPFESSHGDGYSILTVDPSSRCAALKFGNRQLAILPFRQSGDELGEGAEDGFEMEQDAAPPSATLKRVTSGMNGIGGAEAKETPYKASFVLPLTALDPALTHPVHLAFLHEYREPTFGILSAPVQPSAALAEERKDILSYTVFTLDLDQRASTNLISVQKLPSDLCKVVPLPLPVGGALLIGINDLVHVDQSGKVNAVAVNEFAKLASEFSMADQASLNLKLEDCEVELLDARSGDMLLALSDASLAVLSFRLSGRNVAGLSIAPVSQASGSSAVEAAPSCAVALNDQFIFLGSEDGDSTLLGWSKPTVSISRKRSYAQMSRSDLAVEDEDNAEDADEDDLYATANGSPNHDDASSQPAQSESSYSYKFRRCDALSSVAPINNICLGRSTSTSKSKLELLAATGRGTGSRLTTLSRDIVPDMLNVAPFESAANAWSLLVRSTNPEPATSLSETDHDNLICVDNGESTSNYDIHTRAGETGNEQIYSERSGTDFETEGETFKVSTLAKGTRVVQCRRNEIRTYDAVDLSLSQIIPMMDEETDAELSIVHVSFCDPYLLVLRNDSSAFFLKAEDNGDLEPLDLPDDIQTAKWLSGCLYNGELFDNEAVAVLLGEEGGLRILRLSDLTIAYTAAQLSYLPAVLSQDATQRRVGAKETLTEVLFADLGIEGLTQPYLIVRSALDDLTIYEPWLNGSGAWNTVLRFRKVPFKYIPKFDETITEESDGRPAPLQALSIGCRRLVYVHGSEPVFIVKEASSLPKALAVRLRGVKALFAVNTERCAQGFGIIDASGKLQECQLPAEVDYSLGWAVKKMTLGDPAEEVRHIALHEQRQMYVVATCRDVDFFIPGDEGRQHEQDDITLRPQVPRFTLHLVSASSRDVIHSFEMPDLEVVTALKVMPLEISEQTHAQDLRIAVGTALQRSQDMPAKGAVTVFEILQVVPEPDQAESGWKLHVVAREETKGAITAVEAFPDGLIGTGQGQKIMIRGLKEDGSCLPVAFLDAQCYTTQLKTFARSGMFLAGDAWKGLWFGGFTEEPYKLTVLGRSRSRMEVVSAEFLPYDGLLFLLIIDAQMDLHVLQYDPENPKSLSGTRLLHRSTIHLGHFSSGMTLLPSTLTPMGKEEVPNGSSVEAPSLYQVLTTSMTGSLGLITPLDEASYRRLGSIQTQLTSVLEHAAGLNPKAYRAIESEGYGSRGVIDGSLVQRVSELGSSRRSEVLGRAAADAWALRSDSEIVSGEGLSYL